MPEAPARLVTCSPPDKDGSRIVTFATAHSRIMLRLSASELRLLNAVTEPYANPPTEVPAL